MDFLDSILWPNYVLKHYVQYLIYPRQLSMLCSEPKKGFGENDWGKATPKHKNVSTLGRTTESKPFDGFWGFKSKTFSKIGLFHHGKLPALSGITILVSSLRWGALFAFVIPCLYLHPTAQSVFLLFSNMLKILMLSSRVIFAGCSSSKLFLRNFHRGQRDHRAQDVIKIANTIFKLESMKV